MVLDRLTGTTDEGPCASALAGVSPHPNMAMPSDAGEEEKMGTAARSQSPANADFPLSETMLLALQQPPQVWPLPGFHRPPTKLKQLPRQRFRQALALWHRAESIRQDI